MKSRDTRLRDACSGRLAATGLALALGALLAMISIPVLAIAINFPDPGLEAAIRDAIAKPTGGIDDSDVVGLASLDASGRGIVDLEGIQHCTGITSLWLDENEIVGISPLDGLASLEWLDLHGNRIVDISPVSGLANLTGLVLDDNEIVDINPVSGLTKLERLWMSSNSIVNIGPLADDLGNLRILCLNDNEIVDIQMLVDDDCLGAGDSLSIRNNYLDLTPNSLVMQAIGVLLGRGVDVEYAPKKRSASAVVVSFRDPGLEAAIRDAIATPSGDIYDTDLIGLTSLDAHKRSIRNL